MGFMGGGVFWGFMGFMIGFHGVCGGTLGKWGAGKGLGIGYGWDRVWVGEGIGVLGGLWGGWLKIGEFL